MADLLDFLHSEPLFDPVNDTDKEFDQNIRRFASQLKKYPNKSFVGEINGQSILMYLDPSKNTIGYLHVLLAYVDRVKKTQTLPDELLVQVSLFLESFDPVQARYVGEEWRTLLVNMISVSDRNGTAAQAIHPIRTAILRMDPSSSTFTTNHLYFLRMCLNAGMPRQTLPILDKDIYSFPAQSPKGVDERYPCSDHEVSCNYITKNSGISEQITPMQVQEYYLLGAHVYIGVRQYERARLFLELVLSSPTQHVATPMMVEAYKKLILVGLLSQGATFKLPGTIDHGTLRTVQQLSRAYEALADAFKNRDFVKFHAETDTGIAIWREDGNQGIVNEVAEALNRSRIKDLQKTYSALPLERVAIHLSLSQDSTMRLLTAMIQQNHISATITLPTASQPNPANGTSPSAVLRFVPSASANGNVLTEEALLQSRVEMIKHLNAQLKEADRKLSLTKEYIDWKKRNQKADPGDRMDTSLDMPGGYGEDEDMMSDV